MAKQTLTGVFVKEISVHSPPYDKPGVIQEYVGESIYREFDVLKKADSITPAVIEDVLDSARDMIGLRSGRYRIKYSLLVRAPAARVARAKARAFARAKNVTEFNRVEVSSARKAEDNIVTNGYNVTVTVEK